MKLNDEGKDKFAPALRLTSEQILGEQELILSQEFFNEIFGSIAGIGAVINIHRQIIYVNNDFLDMLGLDGIDSILGTTPGEVLSCAH